LDLGFFSPFPRVSPFLGVGFAVLGFTAEAFGTGAFGVGFFVAAAIVAPELGQEDAFCFISVLTTVNTIS
jgi:hypothetical protein